MVSHLFADKIETLFIKMLYVLSYIAMTVDYQEERAKGPSLLLRMALANPLNKHNSADALSVHL